MVSLNLLCYGNDFEHELCATMYAKLSRHAAKIGADRINTQFHIYRDLLVTHSIEEALSHAGVLSGELKSDDGVRPYDLLKGEDVLWSVVHWRGFPKKEASDRWTLREPPPRGMQNAPWPTPILGRGDQGAAMH